MTIESNKIKPLLLISAILTIIGCVSNSMEYRSATTAARSEKNLKKAEEWGLKALLIEADSSNAHIPYFLAIEVYKPRKEWVKMAAMLDEAVRRNPSQQLEKSIIFDKENVLLTIEEGVEIYRAEEWGKLYNLSVDYFQKKQYKLAIQNLEIAILMNPNRGESYGTLAAIYLQEGTDSISEGLKRKIILLCKEAKKGNESAITQLVVDYNIDINEINNIETVDFEQLLNSGGRGRIKAKEVAILGTNNAPEYSINYQVLADISEKEGDLDAAEQYYEIAIENTDNPGPIMRQLVFLYIDKGETQRAIDYSDVLLNKYPNDSDLYFNIGVLFQRLALEAFDPARELYLALSVAPSVEDINQAFNQFNNSRKYAYNARDYFFQASDLEIEGDRSSSGAAKEMRKLMKQIDDIFIPSIREIARSQKIELN